ncbi:hypothetical protein ACFLSP_05395, partial [Bacteroidota bacterium]
MGAQLMMLLKPDSRQSKDLLIGKGAEWRDKTHYKSALAFAWADWMVIFPLLIAGNIGVLTGHNWGYALWLALGILSIYFSILFWTLEKEYTYPIIGWIAYYTYFWGLFLYWGLAASVYSLLILI